MSRLDARKEVLFRIRKYEPGTGSPPRWQEYRLPFTAGMTVLDGLWRIKETLDPTLAWRASCRMGVCGSCGMLINGSARLGCNTQVAELGEGPVSVAPLPNFPILRDLVPDLEIMFDHHAAVLPWIIRDDESPDTVPEVEYAQTAEEMERYLQFSYCIKCACCISACPTCATDREYAGPMPLAQAHRYDSDTRDDGFERRRAVLAGPAGPWRCHFAGECSRVCPKGVDPAKAIQHLKKQLVLDYLGLRRRTRPAAPVRKPEGIERREGIPEAPPPTV